MNDLPENKPPRWALHFLEWFCPAKLLEGIHGDLMEQFNEDVRSAGKRKARIKFAVNVIRFFRPEILVRNKFSIPAQQLYCMIDLTKSYVLVAWRSMLKNRSISLINIIGLSVSMSMGLLILMLIKNQLDYDTFHPNPDRLYRITTVVTEKSGGRSHFATTPFPLQNYLKENFNWVEEIVCLNHSFYKNATTANQQLSLRGIFADASFFNVFGFSLKVGNSTTALSEPFSLVLTEEDALKFFGKKDPMGEIIILEGFGEFKVTGILAELQKPSHLKSYNLASTSTLSPLAHAGIVTSLDFNWKHHLLSYTYVRLKPGTTQQTLMNSLKTLSAHANNLLTLEGVDLNYEFFGQPLDKIRFSELHADFRGGKPIESVIFLAILGCIIVLLAVFNYTNLTVARTLNRAKEIGVRKTAGASRTHLFLQLILESVLISFFALLLATVIAPNIPVNDSFKNDLPKTIDFTLIVWTIIFAIAVGCMAGFFPALVLSKIKPVSALKNLIFNTSKTSVWKNGLIVFQFSLSLVFLIILIVFYQQMKFQVNSDYGFIRKDLLEIELKGINYNKLQPGIESLSGVMQISASSNPIFGSWGNSCKALIQDNSFSNLEYYAVDHNFISTYNLELIAGNNFSKDISGNNEQEIILNERAIESLKLGNLHDAIGKSIIINDTLSLMVAGVVKDFHAHPMKHRIYPIAFRYRPQEFKVLIVKVVPGIMMSVQQEIHDVWDKIEPDIPLASSIFEDRFNERQSHKEDLSMLGSLAAIALVISCLGLLGLVMFSTQSRIKEIGVRKVMGARAFQIINMLSRKFVRLLLIAGLIALPVGYWIASTALQSFAYKIQIGAGLLAIAFLSMCLLGLITIFSQTIKAALRNPVDTLRYE